MGRAIMSTSPYEQIQLYQPVEVLLRLLLLVIFEIKPILQLPSVRWFWDFLVFV
jgi:hypothetical protein